MKSSGYLLIFAVTLAMPSLSVAGSLEESLMKLPPDERARQACILKGLDSIKRDKRLPKADRMKTSITEPASLNGTTVIAKGAAVRSQERWFSIRFSCTVTNDLLKATSFTYELGQEIPSDNWEDLGLW